MNVTSTARGDSTITLHWCWWSLWLLAMALCRSRMDGFALSVSPRQHSRPPQSPTPHSFALGVARGGHMDG